VAALKRGHSYTVYSRPSSGDRLNVDYDLDGHLNVAVLAQLGVPRSADFYLCGPPSFLSHLSESLKTWGVAASQMHIEVFGPSASFTPGFVGGANGRPRLPDGPLGQGPLVTFLRSDLSIRWDARFQSLLDLAEACSVPARWSCRAGVCHTCESGLVDGAVRYRPEPLDLPPAGSTLICCATPLSDVTLDL
jgi:ferredoxin